MTARHPAGLPDLFVDRSLGRRQVPELLRAAGLRLHTLAEVYGIPADEAVEDTEWLELAGVRGWPVLMKDERIRYRTAERDVLLKYGVQAFCLTSGNLRAVEMVGQLLAAIVPIAEACAQSGVTDNWDGRNRAVSRVLDRSGGPVSVLID